MYMVHVDAVAHNCCADHYALMAVTTVLWLLWWCELWRPEQHLATPQPSMVVAPSRVPSPTTLDEPACLSSHNMTRSQKYY